MTAPSNEEYGVLRDRLIAVETKLDLVLTRLGDGHSDHEVRLRTLEQRVDPSNVDHEARIRKLERMIWVASGAASAMGGALGAWMSAVAHV